MLMIYLFLSNVRDIDAETAKAKVSHFLFIGGGPILKKTDRAQFSRKMRAFVSVDVNILNSAKKASY